MTDCRPRDIVCRKGARDPVAPVAPWLICKFLYLFFPRDIRDSFRIFAEAVVQKRKQLGLELCTL
jgi:hypothetical protein